MDRVCRLDGDIYSTNNDNMGTNDTNKNLEQESLETNSNDMVPSFSGQAFQNEDELISNVNNLNENGEVDHFDTVMSGDSQTYEGRNNNMKGNTDMELDLTLDEGQNQKHSSEIGDFNCYCVPFRVSGWNDFFQRSISWFILNREQLFSAFTVALCQIPEVLAGAVIAGINPKYALHSAWLANIVTSLTGGRPGMISGPTFFTSVALIDLVEREGTTYIFYAVCLAGIFQALFGLLGFGALVRMVPYPVIQGFANGMALIIAVSQIRYAKMDPNVYNTNDDRRLMSFGKSWDHITDSKSPWAEDWSIIILILHCIVAFTISFVFPRFTRAVPGAIIALLFGCLFEYGLIRALTDTRSVTIENFAQIKTPYVRPLFSDNEYDMPRISFETLKKVYQTSLSLFGAGLVESLLTSQILDEITEVKGVRNRVALGQGLSNIVCSIFGGMGTSGSLAQTILSAHTDGFTGLSTFMTGIFLLLMITVGYTAIEKIPLGSLAGIMLWVVLNMFDWSALFSTMAAILPLRVRDKIRLDCKISRTDTLIMMTVIGFTICWDSTVAVLSGVVIAVIVYAWDSSNRVVVEREVTADDISSVTYNVSGPLFFATAQSFVDIFSINDIQHDPDEVVILLENAEIFDSSGMVAVKRVYDRFSEAGKVVALSTLSPTSRRIMEKCAFMWQGVNFLEIEEIDDEEMGEAKNIDADAQFLSIETN